MVSTTARHLSAVIGVPLTNPGKPSNVLGNVKAAYDRILGAIDDATVRDVSRFGEVELMRAFGSVHMESLTLAAALFGKKIDGKAGSGVDQSPSKAS
ncbi:hypothetical protein CsSME_00008105 [Camellia sinensis var. sinensis]